MKNEILQDWRTPFAILLRIEGIYMILRRIEGLHVRFLVTLQRDEQSQSVWNPLKGSRIEGFNTIIQPLKDCECSPSRLTDHFQSAWQGWRISLMILRRIEGLHAVLQRVEGWPSSSFEGLNDCGYSSISFTVLQRVEMLPSWSFEGLKDWIFNPLNGWRTARDASKGWVAAALLKSFEGLKESAHFKEFKDHTQSFNPWRIALMVLVEQLHAILRKVEGPHVRSRAILWRVEGFCAALRGVEGSHLQSFEGLKDHAQSFNPSKGHKSNDSRLKD